MSKQKDNVLQMSIVVTQRRYRDSEDWKWKLRLSKSFIQANEHNMNKL